VRLTLVLGEAEARALNWISAREDRAPRHQAERLIRERLIEVGVLDPNPRPCDRPLLSLAPDPIPAGA
jgi:hypothetical protein